MRRPFKIQYNAACVTGPTTYGVSEEVRQHL